MRVRSVRSSGRRIGRVTGLGTAALLAGFAVAAAGTETPSVLVVTVDTLRPDHLSGYGYRRLTSPHLDHLMARGVRFTRARAEEPLTAPALTTMVTSLPPHEHGVTRNGLGMRPGLPSFSKALSRRGWRTAAFVANWTLRDELLGMAEHWQVYEEVLTRRRWFGLFKGEARAADVTDAALDWLGEQGEREPLRPLLLWAHYVEPHAPYRLQEDFLDQLGLPAAQVRYSSEELYDSEIAYCDAEIGRLLAGIEQASGRDEWLIVFTADHGESLGEHGYWGHGRHLYDPGLRVPLAIVWPGHLRPGVSTAPVLLADLAPTILGLAGVDAGDRFPGIDWSDRLAAGSAPPERVTWHQSHRGAVQPMENPERARRNGLLQLARIDDRHKEILEVDTGVCRSYDLDADPAERNSQPVPCSDAMQTHLAEVQEGLEASDQLPPPHLSEEEIERLRALGYLE